MGVDGAGHAHRAQEQGDEPAQAEEGVEVADGAAETALPVGGGVGVEAGVGQAKALLHAAGESPHPAAVVEGEVAVVLDAAAVLDQPGLLQMLEGG